MTTGELSQMQLTTILPLIKKSNLKGLGIVTVSQKGRHTNTSIYNNDGADFGPDTLQGATALGQYGPPYSTSVGADEAVTYANKYNLGIYYISSQVFSFLKSLYDILNGDIVKTKVTVGTNPVGVAITPDGNYAYVANYGSNNVSVIQINSVVNSWHGIKGIIPLNRVYNQDLSAQTNATTTLATASTMSITPSFSGRVKIKAILRGSNNTLADGITVALYNGSTSIDSETYTQEGLASNEHTFALSFDSLSSPLTIGTAYSFTVQFAAVTGGTASIKVIEFSAEEY